MSQTQKNIDFLDDIINNHPVLKFPQERSAFDYIGREKKYLKPSTKMISLCTQVQQVFYNELIRGFSEINNRKINYMEIGLYYGASLVSVLANNFDCLNKVVTNDILEKDSSLHWRHNTVENFMNEFFKGLNKTTGKEYSFTNNDNIYKLSEDLDLTLIVGDCWKIKNQIFDEWGEEKVDIYYYDGDHSQKSQRDAIIEYSDCYADEFIYLADDFDSKDEKGNYQVQLGTKEGIEWLIENGYELLYETNTMNKSKERNSLDGWGGGIYISYLKRK